MSAEDELQFAEATRAHEEAVYERCMCSTAECEQAIIQCRSELGVSGSGRGSLAALEKECAEALRVEEANEFQLVELQEELSQSQEVCAELRNSAEAVSRVPRPVPTTTVAALASAREALRGRRRRLQHQADKPDPDQAPPSWGSQTAASVAANLVVGDPEAPDAVRSVSALERHMVMDVLNAMLNEEATELASSLVDASQALWKAVLRRLEGEQEVRGRGLSEWRSRLEVTRQLQRVAARGADPQRLQDLSEAHKELAAQRRGLRQPPHLDVPLLLRSFPSTAGCGEALEARAAVLAREVQHLRAEQQRRESGLLPPCDPLDAEARALRAFLQEQQQEAEAAQLTLGSRLPRSACPRGSCSGGNSTAMREGTVPRLDRAISMASGVHHQATSQGLGCPGLSSSPPPPLHRASAGAAAATSTHCRGFGSVVARSLSPSPPQGISAYMHSAATAQPRRRSPKLHGEWSPGIR